MIKDDISNTGEFTVGKGNEEIGILKAVWIS